MSTLKKKVISPLRYPGSKATFVKVVLNFVSENGLKGKEIIEPYAGSAIVSLSLIANDIVNKATLVERDPLLYSFWKTVFDNTDSFVDQIENVRVNIESWNYFRNFLKLDIPDEDKISELALAALFLNRTNFSGILHSGPVGGRSQISNYSIDCRFNKKEIIQRIQQISVLRDSISVKFDDAINFLNKSSKTVNSNSFFYIDPPYFKQGRKLYRYHYKIVDHKRLSDILKDFNFPWLLSYDRHNFIELLYDDFYQNHQSFRYMTKSPKREKELVISNMDIRFSLFNKNALSQKHSTNLISNENDNIYQI